MKFQTILFILGALAASQVRLIYHSSII